MDLDALVAPLRADVEHGAAEVTHKALAAFESLLEERRAPTADALRAELHDLAVRVVAAQPAMAPLVHAAAAVLRAGAGASEPEGLVDAVRRAVAGVRERLGRAGREVAERGARLVPAGARVLTVSASSTVARLLAAAARDRPVRAVCLEGRPNLEGRRMATELAAAGVEVTLAVDAAVSAVVGACDLVIVGGDSVGDRGVVNKIGTGAAVALARNSGARAYSAVDTTKILPEGFPQWTGDERPGAEVWADAPEGVCVWNRYFEATPLPLFDGVVTEHGVLDPVAVQELRHTLHVPAALRRAASGAGPRGG